LLVAIALPTGKPDNQQTWQHNEATTTCDRINKPSDQTHPKNDK